MMLKSSTKGKRTGISILKDSPVDIVELECKRLEMDVALCTNRSEDRIERVVRHDEVRQRHIVKGGQVKQERFGHRFI